MFRWNYFPLLSGLDHNIVHSVTAEILIIFCTKMENVLLQCSILEIITAQQNQRPYMFIFKI